MEVRRNFFGKIPVDPAACMPVVNACPFGATGKGSKNRLRYLGFNFLRQHRFGNGANLLIDDLALLENK